MRRQAVVIKKIPVREYDELAVCYTRDSGKQVYHTKSILRPTSVQASHLDTLNYVDFSLVEGNGHPIITSAYCLEAFGRLKSSLPALAAAYFLLECFDKLIFEGEADPKLWDFLLGELRRYNAEAGSAEAGGGAQPNVGAPRRHWAGLISSARRELLTILGYDPNYPIEQLANHRFRSLQFASKVLQYK